MSHYVTHTHTTRFLALTGVTLIIKHITRLFREKPTNIFDYRGEKPHLILAHCTIVCRVTRLPVPNSTVKLHQKHNTGRFRENDDFSSPHSTAHCVTLCYIHNTLVGTECRHTHHKTQNSTIWRKSKLLTLSHFVLVSVTQHD